MLAPRKVRFRRHHRGKMRGKAQRGNTLAFGEFGLQSTQLGWVTAREIEAARIALTRHAKRAGHIWIRIFPHKPVSKKPAETRMGKGKPGPEFWVAVVKPGHMIFEMEGVPQDVAREALRLASHKLSIATQIRERSETPYAS